MDISARAVRLARDNLWHNIRLGHLKPTAAQEIEFLQENIFENSAERWLHPPWDIIVSNPPYISPKAFNRTTSRSVRNHEPKLALVPSPNEDVRRNSIEYDNHVGDLFYPMLLHIAERVRASMVLMEVVDIEQASRVSNMVLENSHWTGCQIWKDWPSHDIQTIQGNCGINLKVRGKGNGRAVLVWNKDGERLIA